MNFSIYWEKRNKKGKQYYKIFWYFNIIPGLNKLDWDKRKAIFDFLLTPWGTEALEARLWLILGNIAGRGTKRRLQL